MKQRNGILGLDTAREVMVTFLILAVTGIAILLAMTSLDTGVGSSIDDVLHNGLVVTNETNAYLNETGYTLSGYNSTWSSITLTAIWGEDSGLYNVSIPLANATTSAVGVITNATAYTNDNVSYSLTYSYTEDTHRLDYITGNLSNGIQTFFASSGTIFSILIVVIIILAISIIIWAVGRFGQQTEGAVNL